MLDVRALRSRSNWTAVTALALAAALLGGCGNDSSGGGRKLTRATAASLQGTLDKVEQNVNARNCAEASQQADALRQEVAALSRVSGDLQRALEASAARLQSLVTDQCPSTTTTTTETQLPSTGTTDEGTTGQQGKKKGPKEKKAKKNEQPPGQTEQSPPNGQGNGGGAALPGESNPNGGN
jgi:hypothetical protein